MGENNLTYIVEDGKRVLDAESKQKMQEMYLKSGGLFPFKLSTNSISKLGNRLKNSMVVTEPQLIIKNSDIHKEVFALILFMLSKVVNGYMYYKVIPVADLIQVYLYGDYHDLGEAYEQYKVLFIKLSGSDMPHVYNAYCVRNVVDLRKQKGLFTYIFFEGNRSELDHPRWCIDSSVSGKYGEKSYEPLTNFIKFIDLNVKDGEKNE